MEYRQSEMRMQQLYTQIRIQVINSVYALTNDRAGVQSSQSARDYAAQALDAEQKKYRLGASTTANVLQMERNLATAEDNLISADAAYARDRASLGQILANTLDKYGVNITEAAGGAISQKPHIPGLTPPQAPGPPKPLTENPPPIPQ
jgi:outer membrane protein TolC